MSQPYEPFGSQDVTDDDGQIIDSFFKETDSPPDLKELQEPIAVKLFADPPNMTRMLTRSQLVNPTDSPIQLFPSDINRKGLTFTVYSPTSVATDGVRIADDKGIISFAGRVLHTPNGVSIDLSGHTGEVWVTSCRGTDPSLPASAPVYVEAWAVTS